MTEGKQEDTVPTRYAFNPNDHITKLPQGKDKDGNKKAADYLEVKWRLVWFRTECPHGTIDTEELEYDPGREVEAEFSQWNTETRRMEKVTKHAKGYARYRATVTDGLGGRATGTKSENAANFADYGEKAETGAVGRALAMLGYGTQFTPEFDEGERIVDSPVDTSTPPSTSTTSAPTKPAVVAQASKPTPATKPEPPAVKPVEVPLDIEALLERMEKELGMFEIKRFKAEIGLDPEIDLRTGFQWNKVSYTMVRDGFNTWTKSDKRQQWLNAPAETKHMLYILSGSSGIISELIKACGDKEQGIQTLNAIRDGDKDMVGLKFKDNPAFTARLADRYIGYYKRGHLTETGQFLVDVPEEFQYKKKAA